jgi:hypothetical protein
MPVGEGFIAAAPTQVVHRPSSPMRLRPASHLRLIGPDFSHPIAVEAIDKWTLPALQDVLNRSVVPPEAFDLLVSS